MPATGLCHFPEQGGLQARVDYPVIGIPHEAAMAVGQGSPFFGAHGHGGHPIARVIQAPGRRQRSLVHRIGDQQDVARQAARLFQQFPGLQQAQIRPAALNRHQVRLQAAQQGPDGCRVIGQRGNYEGVAREDDQARLAVLRAGQDVGDLEAGAGHAGGLQIRGVHGT